MDLALNNLERLICDKIQTNKQTNLLRILDNLRNTLSLDHLNSSCLNF